MEQFFTFSFANLKAISFVFLIGFLPGWILCKTLAIKHSHLIWSHALSMLIFSLTLWGSAQFEFPLSSIQPSIILGVTVLSLIAFYKLTKKNFLFIGIPSPPNKAPFILICISVIAYLSIIGIYDLVPSDILRHMERIQAAARDIGNNNINDFRFFSGISDNYHYYFYAYLMHFANISITNTTWIISALNTTLVLYALFQFAVYQNIESNKHILTKSNLSVLFIVLCLLFFILTKGIAGFSFIRYYSIAPTLLSYAVFLIMIVQIDKYFNQGISKRDVLLLTLSSLFLLLWHMQELLFTLTFVSLLLVYYCLISGGIIRRPRLILGILIVVAIIITVLIQWHLPAPLEKTHRLISLSTLLHLVIPTSIELPRFTKDIILLNPFIQLSQVLGFWGVLVYICACLHFKLLVSKPLLCCGLLIPFVTVLNPLFTDVFLRLRGEDTLYRLLYAVPLSAVAAYIITFHLNVFLTSYSKKRITALIIISILVLGLIPFQSSSLLSQHNRIDDVLPVPKKQSLRHWQDLSHELQTYPEKFNILTDSVTGYIITATTHSINRRYKFTQAQHIDINTLSFNSSNPFSNYKNQYLIINLRNGQISDHGKLSQHWPEDILNVSTYYSKALLHFIKQNPEEFSKLWEKNGITIYLIK